MYTVIENIDGNIVNVKFKTKAKAKEYVNDRIIDIHNMFIGEDITESTTKSADGTEYVKLTIYTYPCDTSCMFIISK